MHMLQLLHMLQLNLNTVPRTRQDVPLVLFPRRVLSFETTQTQMSVFVEPRGCAEPPKVTGWDLCLLCANRLNLMV